MSVIYQGGGFLHGIPKRDLTDEEWQALDKTQQDAALASGLYKAPETPAKKTKRGK